MHPLAPFKMLVHACAQQRIFTLKSHVVIFSQQPVTLKMALQLINSMVQGTEVQKQVIEWKKTLKRQWKQWIWTYSRPKVLAWLYEVTSPAEIKNALHFNSFCDDWCTVSNIGQMYDRVYEAMVGSNVAIKLDEAVRLNKVPNIVKSKE